jgi:3-methyladenine DNA glycosylase AlkD
MTRDEVLRYLEEHGNPEGKHVLMKHGAREPFFNTRIGDMKPLVRKIRKDHELSLALYETGNTDAMYFAGLIADEARISENDLEKWVDDAYWSMLSECAVAWVAAESPHGLTLARRWIDSDREQTACAGWATWGSLLSIRPNDEFDTAELDTLMSRVERDIHSERNRVRYNMNQFVIALGAFVPEYTEAAKALGNRIGTVSVDMGGTACAVPAISGYIAKIEARGRIGKKKKRARC